MNQTGDLCPGRALARTPVRFRHLRAPYSFIPFHHINRAGLRLRGDLRLPLPFLPPLRIRPLKYS